jgi:hypothetical protein
MSSAELLASQTDQAVRRFAIAWRNRTRRLIAPVGVLDHDATGYRFQYLQGVSESVEGFRAFIGFPNLEQVYESTRLWPFFNLRVMDRKRPDFPEYTRWLGLKTDASQLDILSRSGGEQKGDSVYLTEAPAVADDGATSSIFLIRGASYAVRAHNTAAAAESLRAGDQLVLVDDDTNEANPKALLLKTQDGAAVGWMPDLLIEYARQVRSAGGSVKVLQNNGPNSPWHTRLLLMISGHLAPGTAMFSGSTWPPVRGE